MQKSLSSLSWADRLALLAHYTVSDDVACSVFGVTPDELATAKDLQAAGTFVPNMSIDFAAYAPYLSAATSQQAADKTVPATTVTHRPHHSSKAPTAETFAKPESASKRQAAPKKRGRRGDKIQTALLAVTNTPVPVNEFMQKYGVSLAVLRQAKRFAAVHGEEFASKVGSINVRQDKSTKTLMIWKD